jgi:hypothetical protein
VLGWTGAGAAAVATAAEPQELGWGDWTAVSCSELVPILLNWTGSEEIARGFANGMTLAGAGVAPPDRIDGSCIGAREPVGGGAELFGVLDGGGTARVSTVVTSPTSMSRGTFGITRKLVTGSCANFGRDFRLLIARVDAVQDNSHLARVASSVIA